MWVYVYGRDRALHGCMYMVETGCYVGVCIW